ncbi:ketosteroid isomerase, partial [bacterium]|nr:ketosteroid isomerase [bacterium]
METLAEDIDWQSPTTRTQPTEISWAKPRHSREEVATWFKELLEKVQPERLETLEFTAQGDRVIVEGRNRGTVKSTGRAYEHDWVMVFTLREG